MHIINLDANASVPPSQLAKEALQNSLKYQGNPSSPHQLGRNIRRLIDQARVKIAEAMGGLDRDLVFTSGASESNRWLVDSIIQSDFKKIWLTDLEHPSLDKPLKFAFENKTLERVYNLEDAEIIFSVGAHSETGLITNWDHIIKKTNKKTILISDISQTLGRLDKPLENIDILVASAHKIGAFPGAGALLIRNKGKALKSPWTGGAQEGGMRPGTEAYHLINAFGAACSEINQTRQKNKELSYLRDKLEVAILEAWPMAKATLKSGSRLANTSAITLKNTDGEAARILIDSANICVGFGTACSALAPEPSSSLLSLGLSPKEARATIRFSLHPDINEQDIDEAIRRLKNIKFENTIEVA